MTPPTEPEGWAAAYTTLREANEARQVAWANGEAVSLLFRATELGGECGEVLNVCKKIERERQGWRGSRATVEDLADELADVVICADLLAQTEGIDLTAAVRQKFNKTSEKVGLPHRLEAAPPAPVEPMRKALSDEDVERAARAYCATLQDEDVMLVDEPDDYQPFESGYDGLDDIQRRFLLTAMRAALSTLPVAGGGEVAGLIEEAEALHLRSTTHLDAQSLDAAAQQKLRLVTVRVSALRAVIALVDDHEVMVRRLVDALEGRL